MGFHPVGLGLRRAHADVFEQCHAVALVVLKNGREPLKACFGSGVVQASTVNLHRAAIGLVQAGDQTHERAFTGAVFTYQSHRFTGADRKRHVFKRILAGAGVAKAYLAQFHAAVAQRYCLAAFSLRRFHESEVVAAKGGVLEGKPQPVEELFKPLEDGVHGEVHRTEQPR